MFRIYDNNIKIYGQWQNLFKIQLYWEIWYKFDVIKKKQKAKFYGFQRHLRFLELRLLSKKQ